MNKQSRRTQRQPQRLSRLPKYDIKPYFSHMKGADEPQKTAELKSTLKSKT